MSRTTSGVVSRGPDTAKVSPKLKPGPKPKPPEELRERLAVMFKPREMRRIEQEAQRLGLSRSKVIEAIVINPSIRGLNLRSNEVTMRA